jgi:16S rRNA (guanine966-N2)-methyltransferase
MRQAVFSSLAALVPDAICLDLFAGSGSYGLEALSRGASRVVFVERNPKALACLRRNLAAVERSLGAPLEAAGRALIVAGDATTCSPPGDVPDLVFIDPPYELIPALAPALFARLASLLAPKPDAVVVLEYPGELELAPEGWVLRKRLGHGARQPTAGFFRRAPAAA